MMQCVALSNCSFACPYATREREARGRELHHFRLEERVDLGGSSDGSDCYAVPISPAFVAIGTDLLILTSVFSRLQQPPAEEEARERAPTRT